MNHFHSSTFFSSYLFTRVAQLSALCTACHACYINAGRSSPSIIVVKLWEGLVFCNISREPWSHSYGNVTLWEEKPVRNAADDKLIFILSGCTEFTSPWLRTADMNYAPFRYYLFFADWTSAPHSRGDSSWRNCWQPHLPQVLHRRLQHSGFDGYSSTQHHSRGTNITLMPTSGLILPLNVRNPLIIAHIPLVEVVFLVNELNIYAIQQCVNMLIFISLGFIYPAGLVAGVLVSACMWILINGH